MIANTLSGKRSDAQRSRAMGRSDFFFLAIDTTIPYPSILAEETGG